MTVLAKVVPSTIHCVNRRNACFPPLAIDAAFSLHQLEEGYMKGVPYEHETLQ